jgi:hypothetical protein
MGTSKRYIHYLPGGGLGDVYREGYFHNALGILKRWKYLNPTAHLKVLLMSHNPASRDWLEGQPWIDEPVQVRFPLEQTWEIYFQEFREHTELRFTLPDRRTLYRSDMALLRTKVTPVETIQPVGLGVDLVLTAEEQELVEQNAGKLVIHAFAGQTVRFLPDGLRVELLNRFPEALHIGVNYKRKEHGVEAVFGEFKPRVLAGIIRRAKAVIATESSIYYLAAMNSVPFTMLYPRGETYDNVRHGRSDWDWFYGYNDPRSQFVPFDIATIEALSAWALAQGVKA